MPAELKGKITVDTNDLSRAGRAVEAFEDKLRQGFRREPGRRGAVAMEGAFANLASGNIPMAIESITSRFSGMGLVGSGALALVALGLAKGVEEARKFSEAMESSEKVLSRMPSAGASMEDLSKHIANVNAEQEKLNKTSLIGQLLVRQTQYIGGVETAVRGDIAAAERKSELEKEVTETMIRQVEKQKELATVGLMAASGLKAAAEIRKGEIAVGEKLAQVESQLVELREKAADKLMKGGVLNPEAEQIETLAKLKDVLKTSGDQESRMKILAPFLEKAQLTGKEMSAGAGLLSDRLLAKQADRATAMGDAFRQQGFTSLAAEQYAQAQVWKNQMSGSLKENERTPEFALKNAIDGAQVFQSMIEELQKLNEGVNKISFANQ
jgi:hypothetical protein